MSDLDKLIKHFEKFPGVGIRQAKRFAFHILTLSNEERNDFVHLVDNVHTSVRSCLQCQRFFTATHNHNSHTCDICNDESRDKSKLLVVEKDNDIIAIEKSDVYNGLYFVLGGTVPLLNEAHTNKLRGGALKVIVNDRMNILKEIILGFSVNPDGENTANYVESLLKDNIEENQLKISLLGRGLSTGSELEYADPDTIKSALSNRN